MKCNNPQQLSPVILNAEIEDIFPEPFLLFSKTIKCLVSPKIYFYDVELKEKNHINSIVKDILSINRDDKTNVCPIYTANGYHILARNAVSFLPVKIKEIKNDSEKIQEYRKEEIFSGTKTGFRTYRYYFDGGLQFMTYFMAPHVVLKKDDTDYIRKIEYCCNSFNAIQKITINWFFAERKMKTSYLNVKDSTMPSWNYVDFITANCYSERAPMVVYSRSKWNVDFVDVPIYSSPIIPFIPTNIASALTYKSIKDTMEDQSGVEARAGFTGFSKDLITKFIKSFGFRIFNQWFNYESFFLINGVPIDNNNKVRRNRTFVENYIYNNFDSINSFVPKFTSNLCYLYQDSWTWIQLDRLANTKNFFDDYLDSSPGLMQPDKETWKTHLENLLSSKVSNVFKLILFELWNKDSNPEVKKRKKILDKLLAGHENYIDNPDYLPQIRSKLQPVQILLKSRPNRVPIFFYSEINPVKVDIDKILQTINLPKESGEYSIRIVSEGLDNKGENQIQKIVYGKEYGPDHYLKIVNQIYIITVEDKELYKSVMMPDFLPIKKSVLGSRQIAYLLKFEKSDYKYKEPYYSTYRYLQDKAIEYYENLDIPLLKEGEQEKDRFESVIQSLDSISNSAREKFYLEYYEITPELKLDLTLRIKISYNENNEMVAEIKSITLNPEIDSILYPRKSYDFVSTSINKRQLNYANFITHKNEIIEPKYVLPLPSIFSQPEIKILGLDKENNFSFKLILGYKELILESSNKGILSIKEDKIYPPFATLLTNYLYKKDRSEKFIEIWPFKWIDTKNLK